MKNTIVEKWLKKITSAKDKMKRKHGEDARKSEKEYYNDKDNKSEFPIYRSSVSILRSALYSKPPIPEIRTRKQDDKDGKQISKVLEQAINYEIDNRDFYADTKRAVLDYMLCDMGIMRVRYDVKLVPQRGEDGQPLIGEDDKPLMTIGNQSVYLDHWSWKRFCYDIGKDWDECEWIDYEHYMTPTEIEKKYKVKLGTTNTGNDGVKKGKVIVHEIWDKKTRTVIELMSGYDKVLRQRKDPLKLKDFFDCPKPLMSNMNTDQYIPQSEYVHLERQINAINETERRITALVKTIESKGFYASEIKKDLSKLVNAKDGQLLPVDGLRELMDGSPNFDNVIVMLPILQQAQVLSVLEDQKAKQKEQYHELTGVSDIIRGSTKASETATAQQIKGQWANIALLERQATINSCWRSIMRLYSEIISEHFTPEQLTLMTGTEVTPEMKQIMNNDVMRCYAIDVETDSTIAADESQEKQDRMDMVNNMISVLANLLPAVQAGTMNADFAKELALTAVRGFKHARSLEDLIAGMGGTEEQLQGLQQQLQQMQQQSEQMQMQAQQQLEQAVQQIQQLQAQLQQVNEREEARKDTETQGEAMKDQAQAGKEAAQAEKLRAEAMEINQTIGMNNQMGINYGGQVGY